MDWKCAVCDVTMPDVLDFCMCGAARVVLSKNHSLTIADMLTSRSIVLFEGDEQTRNIFIKQHMPLFGSTYSYGHIVYSRNTELADFFKRNLVGVYGVSVVHTSRPIGAYFPWASLSMSGANMAVFDNLFTQEEFTECDALLAYPEKLHVSPGLSSNVDWFSLALENEGGYFAFWVLIPPGWSGENLKRLSSVVELILQTEKYTYYRAQENLYRLPIPDGESTSHQDLRLLCSGGADEMWDTLHHLGDVREHLSMLDTLQPLPPNLWVIVMSYVFHKSLLKSQAGTSGKLIIE